MRRTLVALALFGSGCIAGSAAVQRDDRVLRELTRQERWAQQALDARPTRDQLDAIRGSDYGSVGAARKEFQKLIMAVDRGTWIRETAAEMLREERGPPPEDQTKIRAKMADLDRSKEEQKRATPLIANAPPTATSPPSPSTSTSTSTEPPREAEAPSTTLKIAADAASMIAKKAPKSIT